ncbi:hypothetical protein DSO57_1003119 [Entomophthora muscae]|uniref:Uncharacterized protein n=1 Tax=Entomophthora muscae TaxID=34485 RepID=A0ACC2UV52_9FUNG|nr:hypothetical protein DSO57_1003119 [Entomophthora muscae]
MKIVGDVLFKAFSILFSLFYGPQNQPQTKAINAVREVKLYHLLSDPIILSTQMQWSIPSYQFTEYHIRTPIKQTEYLSGNDTYTEFRRRYWIPPPVNLIAQSSKSQLTYYITPRKPKYPVISLDRVGLPLPQLQKESIHPEVFGMASNNTLVLENKSKPQWRPVLLVVDAMCETCIPRSVVSARFNVHFNQLLDGIYVYK